MLFDIINPYFIYVNIRIIFIIPFYLFTFLINAYDPLFIIQLNDINRFDSPFFLLEVIFNLILIQLFSLCILLILNYSLISLCATKYAKFFYIELNPHSSASSFSPSSYNIS